MAGARQCLYLSLIHIFVVILAGGVFTYQGIISYGDFAAFMLFVNLFINPVKKLINFMEQYQNGMTGFPVSYTHLDVYKRQGLDYRRAAGSNGRRR